MIAENLASVEVVAETSPDGKNIKLTDDFGLLDTMIADSQAQTANYQPGPYWMAKSKNAAKEIKNCGIGSFRKTAFRIGESYADFYRIDIREAYNYGWKQIPWRLMNVFPFSKMFDYQVQQTRSYTREITGHVQEILKVKPRSRYLLKKYKMPYSLLGGCLRKAKIDGQEFSTHYMSFLEEHDNIASRVQFDNARSIFEIGGGFGVNVHLLLENYKNITKVLYLDIPPNLYVGTQYLKAFFGSAVADYNATKDLDSIQFLDDDKLEILCVAPWQIEKFKSQIDIFTNSRSFVEMPINVVKNYVEKFNQFPGSKDTAIALLTYDKYDLAKTFHPDKLPKFFEGREFEYFESERILDSARKNLYYVSPGKLKK